MGVILTLFSINDYGRLCDPFADVKSLGRRGATGLSEGSYPERWI
jgi:hypothetical protein